MSLVAASQRQKASEKRRVTPNDRARPGSASGTNGSRSAAAVAQQYANLAAATAIDTEAKEFFSGDRFQHGRDAAGCWLSRFRSESGASSEWRQENKMRTVAAALCLCLNIGTDPPGVDRPVPCATLECWIDPNEASAVPAKSLELIGTTLQAQYTRWQPKAKYELLLDPTSGSVKRMCVALRRTAKHERILFHYNGHGVPKPTVNGELWVFDKSYTLYVPLSIYDLLTWLGGPAILVLDCSAAGALGENFQLFLRQKAEEARQMQEQDPEKAALLPDYSECILLGACALGQSLPLTPATLPMDLFTSCLTTPLRIALKFFAANSVFGGAASFDAFMRPGKDAHEELLDKIPGKLNDRKTPLGELNWIYTAITDTIAWTILPRDMFQKLFRQDLLLSSLLRNFLLATRILAHFGCTTVSHPALPQSSLIAKHPMWASWDLCCEQYLLSLDKYLNFQQHALHIDPTSVPVVKFPREHINFFAEHLLAFEVWLEVGSEAMGPPIQLPIVLQVLLSQVHRRRALILLARFLGKGQWAVSQALSVGIFPYVLKLLQSPDLPLREVLVFIWSKLLALDRSVQVDVIKERNETYFVSHLASPPGTGAAAVSDRQRVMSGFVLSALCDGYPTGQRAILRAGAMSVAARHLDSESPSLRKWMCLLLGKLWDGLEEARAVAVAHGVPEKLCGVIADPVPEVRAAALYALGTFMSAPPPPPPSSTNSANASAVQPVSSPPLDPSVARDRHATELMLAKNFSQLVVDASPLVREELVLALAQLVEAQKDDFLALAHDRIIGDESNTHLVHSASMTVPPSPLQHGISSPPYSFMPSPSPGVSSTAPSSVVGGGAFFGGSLATTPANVTSPALRGQMTQQQLQQQQPTSATSTLTRTQSEAASHGLAISISPSMMTGAGKQTPATPLSPFQLHPWNGSVSTTAPMGTRSASGSSTGHLTSPPTPLGSNRGSLVRTTSMGSMSNSSPESIQYNQRLLLWRVIRTLSHDPFPSVAAVAIHLRRLLTARSFQAPTISIHHAHQTSMHGSPLTSSTAGPLNTVPEQSLNDYTFLDTPSTGTASRSSWDGGAATQPPAHQRGRSDGYITLSGPAPFEAVTTRPRSRPASEIEHPPLHHGVASANASANASVSHNSVAASILGVMGSSSSSSGSSAHRSASPSMSPHTVHRVSTSANPSPAASPKQHAIVAPGQQSARKALVGQRLTFEDDARATHFGIPPSTIYDRSCEYFVAPVGSVASSGTNAAAAPAATTCEDADAVLERLLITSWRAKRNADVLRTSSQIRGDYYDVVDRGTFDQIAALSTGFDAVSAMLFHPFEPMLVVSERRQIAVWDCKEYERVNQFSNENARGTKISAITWINEQHQSLLLAGSDDGVVRLWKNVHQTGVAPDIVSAWLAVRSMPRGTGVGLVLDWQQEKGHLLAAGPVDSIRVWDVEREICVLDLPVDSDSYVSSVCSTNAGGVVFAGCGDGIVRLFDLRADSHQIHTVTRHTGSVVAVRAQKRADANNAAIVSGGLSGDIHTTDLRMLGGALDTISTSAVTHIAGFEKPVLLDALAIHDHAPIFAAGSRKQVVRVADFKNERGTPGNTISTLKYHKGFMGQRLSPVTALTFHPHQLMLAVGTLGPDVPIYSAQPSAVRYVM